MEGGENLFFVDTRNPKAWAEANAKLPQASRVPADAVEEHFADIPRDRWWSPIALDQPKLPEPLWRRY